MSIGNKKYTDSKNKRKIGRVVLQITFLLLLLVIAVNALFTITTYIPYKDQNVPYSGDKGFIALSYFGVERVSSSHSLIGIDRLKEHMDALKNAGFVTITQKDIIDYYKQGKTLPEKSLFMSFEDGRRDTAIFTQKLFEELNYKGTILTYAENLDRQDPKFLRPDELVALEKTSYWELGTNGYRLFFINVFDRYDNYIGELTPLEYVHLSSALGRRYNHYLMDYIRDENLFPRESYGRMKRRIDYDYESLREAYMESIGHVPGMYILMHSNTGSFGNNDKVSAINEYWITSLFDMNFNREGLSHNDRTSSIYDLTRMQPQAYWYPNHLIMRIADDNKQQLPFIMGDFDRHRFWEVQKGAAEINMEKIILTSLPEGSGLMRLKSTVVSDIKLSTRMTGNKFGMQRVLMRADENYDNFVAVQIFNNYLYVIEKIGGTEKEIFKLNLDRHDGLPIVSVEEDRKEAEVKALEALLKYSPNKEKAKIYAQRLADKHNEKVRTVAEGAEEYTKNISIHEPASRLVEVDLKNDFISVSIDGKVAAESIPLLRVDRGGVALETYWGGHGWSQRNIADDVYDGVFEAFSIYTNSGREKEVVVFEDKPREFDTYKLQFQRYWEKMLRFFIANF